MTQRLTGMELALKANELKSKGYSLYEIGLATGWSDPDGGCQFAFYQEIVNARQAYANANR